MVSLLKRIDAEGKDVGDLERLSLRNRNVEHGGYRISSAPARSPAMGRSRGMSHYSPSPSPSASAREDPAPPARPSRIPWTLLALALSVAAAFWGWTRSQGPSMGAAALERKFNELSASHEQLMESLARAQQAADAPRSRLDSALADLTERVDELRAAVAEVSEDQNKEQAANAAAKKTLSSLEAQIIDADRARREANTARDTAVDTRLAELRKQLAAAEKRAQELAALDPAAAVAAAKEEALSVAAAAVAAEVDARAAQLRDAGSVAVDAVLAAAESKLSEVVRSEVAARVAVAAAERVESALAGNKPGGGSGGGGGWFGSSLAGAELEEAVRGVLGRLYKERIGQVDWLLEINGATVGAASPSLALCSALDFACMLRNAYTLQTDPKTFLRVESTSTWWWSDASGSMLGNCWAMAGSEGFIHISLAQAVLPTSFVLQHAPSTISADSAASAPLRFRVRGFEAVLPAAGETGVVLVEGEYKTELAGDGDALMSHLQAFPVAAHEAVRSVRLEVLSNHGKEAFTCLYHMRMHGEAAT